MKRESDTLRAGGYMPNTTPSPRIGEGVAGFDLPEPGKEKTAG